VCCGCEGFGSCIVSDRVRQVAILVDPYVLLGLCLVGMFDTVGFRVGHFGIWMIRVAIGLFDGSRWGLSFLEKLSVVPGIVSTWAHRDAVDLRAELFEFFIAQSFFQLLARLVNAVILLLEVRKNVMNDC
jgi:hypothetical protein